MDAEALRKPEDHIRADRRRHPRVGTVACPRLLPKVDTTSGGTTDMSNQPPPVPPAGRSDKGPGGSAHEGNSVADIPSTGGAPANLKEQDRQGNTKQNTTNKGYQQDR
jgi:hypothetical protein